MKLVIAGLVLACAVCDYASAGCDKAYATIGAGYKIEEPTHMQLDGKRVKLYESSPYSARFEAGIVCNENLRFGVAHHSQWADGFPFNDKGEPFKTELFVDYTYYWDI